MYMFYISDKNVQVRHFTVQRIDTNIHGVTQKLFLIFFFVLVKPGFCPLRTVLMVSAYS